MTPTQFDYYAIEELLTDEERAARDRARRFVQEEVLSEIVPCHRAGKFPEQLTPRMGALGFYAPYLKEHGCAGLSYTAYGLIMQELERADSGLRSLASVQGALAIQAIHSFGTCRASASVVSHLPNTDTAQIRAGWKPALDVMATITF